MDTKPGRVVFYHEELPLMKCSFDNVVLGDLLTNKKTLHIHYQSAYAHQTC